MLKAVNIGMIVLLGTLVAPATGGEPTLSLRMHTEKDAVMQGEPCMLALTFENRSQQDVTIGLGPDGVAAFSFELLDQRGERVAKAGQIWKPGLSRIVTYAIKPGSSVEHKLLLNRWCSTLLPEAEYRVLCRCEPVVGPTVQAGCALRLVPARQDELERLFAGLAACVLAADARVERSGAEEMLTYANSPTAVPHLLKVVEAEHAQDRLRALAVTGLRNVGTPEAIAALLGLAKGERSANLPHGVQKWAALAIFQIHNTSRDPRIRAACAPFCKETSRPFVRPPGQ